MSAPDLIVVGQVLPDEFAAELRTLRADRAPLLNGVLRACAQAGWTNAALGKALGITGERVRQLVAVGYAPVGLTIPDPPRREPKPKRQPPQVPASTIERLRKLHRIARTVNGVTLPDDPRRKASVELAALMNECVQQGFGTVRIGKVLGVTVKAVQFYLGRHGYRKLPPSIAYQAYKGEAIAVVSRIPGLCPSGHPMTGDNVGYNHGYPRCRECARIRGRERYHATKRGAA